MTDLHTNIETASIGESGIPFFTFAELDSTSLHAMELMRTAKTPLPFAVHALRQSKGRGRLGQQWESPLGNLFLSLGLPISSVELTLIPFAVAVLVAEWIQAEFGFRVTLKWPNDVYFSGRKLAGILCEMHAPGGKLAAGCVVGIGINCEMAPRVSGTYPNPTSLQEILGDTLSFDTEKLSRSLAGFMVSRWGLINREAIYSRWHHFAIGKRQPWCLLDKALSYRFDAGLNESGHLLLTDADNQNPIALTSSHHEWRWAYMRDQAGSCVAPFAVIEIGNSTVKFQVISLSKDEDQILFQDRAAVSDDAADVLTRWQEILYRRSLVLPCIFLAEVAPTNASLWIKALGALGCPLVAIEKRWLRAQSSYDLNQIGLDRLAAIECAYAKKLWGQEAIVLVSAGTALTADLLTKSRHLGGFITVGLGTAGAILPKIAPALPKVTPALSQELPQQTEAAISQAVILEKIGLIYELQKKMVAQASLNQVPLVILTGGDREILGEALPEAKVLDATFLFQGYRILALGG